jgi:aminopeptidase N
MSARNDPTPKTPGDYRFEMPQPVPSYLIAIGVGDLQYKAISKRSGVYAEPSVLDRAAREFEDTEKMIQAAESLYGVYRWEQYDMLILPPSFPYGGMENPRLTFLTPTVLAGDKSLVGLISHELAHSWSGNLVTNATWRDFWLNEGFTTYFERRIQEAVYGPARSEMEALLERNGLERELAELPERDEILYIDLKGRDPDDGATDVPYVKGMLFLRHLEEVFGRPRFDAFLRGYFSNFAFQSITTGDFVKYLRENLFAQNPDLAGRIDVDAWLTQPGLPASAPHPKSDAFDKVTQAAQAWLRGSGALASVPTRQWTTQEWLHFLTSMPEKLNTVRMAELDRAFHFTSSGNVEIVYQWLLMSIRSGYGPAYPRLERFLMEVGRRKYIKPLYTELAKTPEGKKRAQAIYAKARPGYHPIAIITIDELLGR